MHKLSTERRTVRGQQFVSVVGHELDYGGDDREATITAHAWQVPMVE